MNPLREKKKSLKLKVFHAGQKLLSKTGWVLKPSRFERKTPIELHVEVCKRVDYVVEHGLSHTSRERLFATALAMQYVLDSKIPGAFVECGVWKGGNSLVAKAVNEVHGSNRTFYLYDTYEGHVRPGVHDISLESGIKAAEVFDTRVASQGSWNAVSVLEVKNNFADTGLSIDNVMFIAGDMLHTLCVEENLPEVISVLRLDTDWYEPTKLQLEKLWPRLAVGGVLVLDDYGHWAGSKKAVDEFFENYNPKPFFAYTDWSGRTAVKLG
jgi:hypothetical protein